MREMMPSFSRLAAFDAVVILCAVNGVRHSALDGECIRSSCLVPRHALNACQLRIRFLLRQCRLGLPVGPNLHEFGDYSTTTHASLHGDNPPEQMMFPFFPSWSIHLMACSNI